MKKSIALPAFLLGVTLLLCVCLCGCSQNAPGFPAALSDPARSMYELAEENYKDAQLVEIYNLMASSRDINDVNKKYAITCLRQDDDGYHTVYVGENQILVLYFDKDANWIERSKLESLRYTVLTRAYFDKLQVGDPIAKVQYADPSCYLPFLLDREGHELVSDHYSQDGYHTRITYDDNLKIKSIDYDIA